MHGLSLAQEDICRAQDIFGGASVCELKDLANDNGRVNENGEKDPNGRWSSGRDGLSKVFYFVLFHIWSWEDATRIWNHNSNPEYTELRNLRFENKKNRERIYLLCVRNSALTEEKEANTKTIENLCKQLETEKNRAKTHESEIIRLKAKLYDLIKPKPRKRGRAEINYRTRRGRSALKAFGDVQQVWPDFNVKAGGGKSGERQKTLDNLTENFQNGERGEETQNYIEMIDDAYGYLEDAESVIDQI